MKNMLAVVQKIFFYGKFRTYFLWCAFLAGKTVLALIDWKTVLNKFAQNIFRGFDFEFEV